MVFASLYGRQKMTQIPLTQEIHGPEQCCLPSFTAPRTRTWSENYAASANTLLDRNDVSAPTKNKGFKHGALWSTEYDLIKDAFRDKVLNLSASRKLAANLLWPFPLGPFPTNSFH